MCWVKYYWLTIEEKLETFSNLLFNSRSYCLYLVENKELHYVRLNFSLKASANLCGK